MESLPPAGGVGNGVAWTALGSAGIWSGSRFRPTDATVRRQSTMLGTHPNEPASSIGIGSPEPALANESSHRLRHDFVSDPSVQHTTTPRLLIISPVRNEADYLQRT